MAQPTKRGVLLGLPKTTACELQSHPHFAIAALNGLSNHSLWYTVGPSVYSRQLDGWNRKFSGPKLVNHNIVPAGYKANEIPYVSANCRDQSAGCGVFVMEFPPKFIKMP